MCKRCCCAAEAPFYTIYKNAGQNPGYIGLTPVYPAKVVPIDLGQYSGLTVAPGAFFASQDE